MTKILDIVIFGSGLLTRGDVQCQKFQSHL